MNTRPWDSETSWGQWDFVAAAGPAAKILEAVRAHPLDRRNEDLEALARGFGTNGRGPGGSHVDFTDPRLRERITYRAPPDPAGPCPGVRGLVDRVRQA